MTIFKKLLYLCVIISLTHCASTPLDSRVHDRLKNAQKDAITLIRDVDQKNINEKEKALFTACESALQDDAIYRIKLYLDENISINSRNTEKSTPLMTTIESSREKTFRFLLKYDPDVNLQDIHGENAFTKLLCKTQMQLDKLSRLVELKNVSDNTLVYSGKYIISHQEECGLSDQMLANALGIMMKNENIIKEMIFSLVNEHNDVILEKIIPLKMNVFNQENTQYIKTKKPHIFQKYLKNKKASVQR